MEVNDISDILSREIIPQLDIRTIYTYLEGAVNLKSSSWDVRKTIVKEKILFFQKHKDFALVTKEDSDLLHG